MLCIADDQLALVSAALTAVQMGDRVCEIGPGSKICAIRNGLGSESSQRRKQSAQQSKYC